MSASLLSPRALNAGDTIGVFTPSFPGYQANPGLFENGIRNLERMGFRVKLGSLTEQRLSQGYRSAPAQARAAEFMALIADPGVHALMPTIGGSNSSSLIPYLDFEAIRASRKLICGYSDLTSLHCAILKFSGLRTFYGPSVMCWFGDWPDGIPESAKWFLDAVQNHRSGTHTLEPPTRLSRHQRSWENGEWKLVPREWQRHEGWKVLRPGEVEAPLYTFNLNTLLSTAGTPYWPDLKGVILVLEEMDAPLGREERAFRQLQAMGVFEQVSALILNRPETENSQGAPFGFEELLLEVLNEGSPRERKFPVVSDFDCGHTVPMITLPQGVQARLRAELGNCARFELLESGIQ